MMSILILLLWFVLAFVFQLHVLPVWGWVHTTPELMIAVCAVGSMVYGRGRTLPFALIIGAAADLTIGYGYGMFLLPMTAAVLLFGPLEHAELERPFLPALYTGGAAVVARLFRSFLLVILGHGFFPAGREWIAFIPCGLFSALIAAVLLFVSAKRFRREREGRYRL